MEATDVVQGYFDAWNRHDPEAIAATFVQGGTYTDPNVPEGLSGRAIAEYASGLFAAFPDLLFDLVSHSSTDDGVVAARWVMRGTNTGPLRGNPPTGGTVALPGADFIAVEGDKIRSVQGYFDRSTFVEQLGLQVIVQPRSVGPFSFGSSVRAQSGKRTKPGAVSLTWIQVRSEEEAQEVRNYSRAAAAEMVDMPGFIAWIGVTIAQRLFTITAWEDTESPQQLRHSAPHEEAVEQFFSTDFATSVLTSVWKPERINALWVRCGACGSGIVGIAMFTLTAITFTIVITWVFNNTRASVLLAILVHSSIDTFTIPLAAIFPAWAIASALPLMIGFGVVAVALMVLTRGRLDYQRLAEAQSPPRVR